MKPTLLARFAFAVALGGCPCAVAQPLTQQAQCAAQAKTEYVEAQAEWKQKRGGAQVVTSNYSSHYNTKLQKCLMLLSMTTTSETHKDAEIFTLTDAYERRGYAFYFSEGGDARPNCFLWPTHTETIYCKTRAEFDEFIASYMEQ